MQLTPRDKKMLIVLGAVAGVAILFLLYQFVLKGGGGETVATGPTVGPTVAPTAQPSQTPRETPPPPLIVGGRDPFSVPPALCGTGGGVSPSPGVTASPGTTSGAALPGCPTTAPSSSVSPTVSPSGSVSPSPSQSPSGGSPSNPNTNTGGRHPMGS